MVTFHLRQDARWSDGTPVTAEDVRFTYLVQKDPRVSSPGLEIKDFITDVQVVGRFTVMKVWNGLPKHLQLLLESTVRDFSFNQFTTIQGADLAYEKFKKAGVEIIRLKDADIEKFRKFAPELWVKWAKMHPLAMKAFKSQWEYMKSVMIGYYKDADLVDLQGKPLSL